MVMEIQNTKIIPGYKLTEVGVIPEEWDVKKLSEVCNYQNGTSLEKYFNGFQGLSVISIGNYSIDGKYVDTNSYIDWKYHREIKRFILHHNELCMILNDKTSIGAIIGRVLLVKEDNKYVFNQRSMRIVPHETILPLYLYYVINSDLLHNKIVSLAKPGTQIYVNTGDITGLDILLPSLREQHAIATALSDIDALITLLDKLITKKRDIKQATMQQLLTGKTRLPGFSGEWKMKTFGEVMTGFVSGATPSRGRPDFFKGNIRWITSGELNYNVIMDTIEKISIEAVSRTNLKLLPKGTFLMAITGLEAEGTRGSCGIVGAEATTNQSCMALFPTKELSTDYLFHYYTYKGKSLALEYCQGTKQQSYTGKIVKLLPILLPPRPEQQAIATVLSDMDAEIAALEQKCEKTRMMKQGMMQELLTGKIRLT